ncbi:hypothetical protein [Leptospira ilyithenensis]|uniref:Lipoprotein n=1 Tax=Leptospira ilyithenensis TaxID=2484901 RepID=A0A4R9LNI3_9LEPT|nr:hypothetical protein [Leptospira ilyithenensis]TGN10388.1 hypothetical protein EHS11_08800 [Leptospira ilyithenensis]
MKKIKNRKKNFPFFSITLFAYTLLFSCGGGGSSSSGDAALLLPILGGSSSGGSGSSSNASSGNTPITFTGTSGTPSFYYYESNSDSVKISGQSLNVTVNNSLGSSTATKQIVISTDSTLDANDTVVGTFTFGNSGYTVNVPTGLVASGTLVPVRYYYGLIPRETGSPSPKSVLILPSDSGYMSTSSGTVYQNQILNDTTPLQFYSFYIYSTTSKFTLSAHHVSSGLDVALLAMRADGTTIGPDVNANSTNNYEFGSYTASGGILGSNLLVRVRRIGTTQGTFSFHALQNGLVLTPLGTSCSGGTGVFANRCVTYPSDHLNRPTNSSTCAAFQGTGSTFSASVCNSTNLTGKCFANPLTNNGRAVISFYSPETTSDVNTTCSGDISY